MEPPVVRSRGRPRKRRLNEAENIAPGHETKNQAVERRPVALMGRYVLKEFDGIGIFLGKVVHYDQGLYRVNYEDGDCEDLESGEIRGFMLGDYDFDHDLSRRKKKLDGLVSKISANSRTESEKKTFGSLNGGDKVEASALSKVRGGVTIENDGREDEGHANSSSDSCEYVRDGDSELDVESPPIPPPELPPSSGTIGVPEKYVSYLFSAYGFLRSFSIPLFLSPFTLDDFVGSLNCCVANTLLDAVHVALMRALRHHLETLSSDGLELASKCLRCIDWSLLDTLTWPAYLVHYLMVMGYTKGPEWRGFYDKVLVMDYYCLPADRKLMILQILCDDVLESAEIRAEIDTRKESEVGLDYDTETTNPNENVPRRVHPRYSKTSACKDREAMGIIAETYKMNSSGNSNSLGFKGTKRDVDAADIDVDRNGDECRLCGMDGILLCCDGCPSAYHSRCIGVMKMFIPEGPWYCPECTINKIGPTVAIGTSLKGAEILGIDLNDQVFFGTCDHLLVLGASIDPEPCFRYYNQNDIPTVLQAFCSSVKHTALYMGVCKAILQYWSIPESIFSLAVMNEMRRNLACVKDVANLSILSFPSEKEEQKVPAMLEAGNYVYNEDQNSVNNAALSCLGISLNGITRTDFPEPHTIVDTRQEESALVDMNLTERIKRESAISNGSDSQQADPSDLTHQSLVDRADAVDLTTCTSRNIKGSSTGYVNDVCFPVSLASQSREGDRVGSRKSDSNSDAKFLYLGSFHKPQAYINHYMHGDFAASAAAKLAVLSSEEIRVPEGNASENSRKVASSNNFLQAKAFSLTASRFFWPSSEKKLVEVPRERCGWCLSCKAPVSSKRGCMLNHACLSATKGAMKILAGFRPIKSGEGSLASIATYILYMEACLHGLLVGPFQSASYRKHWHKQVEQASTFRAIKALLLELEEHISIIALSGDWVKLVDGLSFDPSLTQSASCTVTTTHKRGLSGRRKRKQSAASEVTDDSCQDQSFTWWQGGKLSKLIFQKAILPRLVVKKAARQGGWRKISGIYYVDSSEIPKRSRQLVWRAAVEMSKNTSQLALQVRYLDFHLRWSDLLRPEQNLQDGKGVDTEASAFRNAVICAKTIVGNKVRYAVVFGNQRHLPSRIMKNIIEIEQSQDGKHKYWFSESRIPLYLIKEYGENVDEVFLPSVEESMNVPIQLQRRCLKASRQDIFFYLTCKRDKLEVCSCSSCQLDVLIRNAVMCRACQGYCHESCILNSTMSMNEEVEFFITCKRCFHAKALAQKDSSNESPTTPLALQGQEYPNLRKVTKGGRPACNNQSLASVRTQATASEFKQATSDSSLTNKSHRKLCSWGIMWKKKQSEDTGIEFRVKNILLRGSLDDHQLGPVCHLCHKPYRSDLMYIYCETCQKWYHAEAVELDESKIFYVKGFKCCKCRRIRSPLCPYMDPKDKLSEGKKTRLREIKQGRMRVDSDSGFISEFKECEPPPPVFLIESKECEPATPVFSMEEVLGQEFTVCEPETPLFPMDVVSKPEYDPLLLPHSGVELITEHDSELDIEWNTASGPGLQKLPVRRHVKHEGDADGIFGSNLSDAEVSTHVEANNLKPTEATSPHVEWDVESEMMLDYQGFNYEDMEFEPQTYFTVTELLASDDVDNTSGDWSGSFENPSCKISPEEIPGQYRMDSDQLNPATSVKPTINMGHCHRCLHTEPAPDLSCQICGLQIHTNCSPWAESSFGEGSWKCGNCQE
ncbi:DDT domain-containing protein PTM-like isoform X1 [Carya illinoinensis]|uniref:DDT domain-containing protein PTM-like isoform X1 n=1 Tax=Carya illinoinensis TaxID=32201 RepID=UPI001C72668F|nr:DDT domain-containing protein PTM-like isoform X1 [Carya illinoinensis]XP_042959198.1 DDT domain-containing protein PTM-like isoform X1 [Carya illinoinensis]